MDILSEPLGQLLLGGGGVVVLLVVFAATRGRRKRKAKQPVDDELKKLLDAGDHAAAARLEMRRGHLDQALELFMHAGQPHRAAEMAVRLNRHRQAAELYERIEDYERAIHHYNEAGLKQQAKDVQRLARKQHIEAAKDKAAEEAGKPNNKGPGRSGRADFDTDSFSPVGQARSAEERFAELRQAADQGDSGARKKLSEVGREAAEALMAAGDLHRAADVCQQAGLVDQAINLYVNLLGEPAEAARLLANRGDHRRAAELYELAGKVERALGAWIQWADKAGDPLEHLEKVDRLGPEASIALLDTVASQRSVEPKTLKLHFRVATAYEQRNRADSALALLQQMEQVDPGYGGVREAIRRLLPHVAKTADHPAGGPAPGPEPVADTAHARTVLGPGPGSPPPGAPAAPRTDDHAGAAPLPRPPTGLPPVVRLPAQPEAQPKERALPRPPTGLPAVVPAHMVAKSPGVSMKTRLKSGSYKDRVADDVVAPVSLSDSVVGEFGEDTPASSSPAGAAELDADQIQQLVSQAAEAAAQRAVTRAQAEQMLDGSAPPLVVRRPRRRGRSVARGLESRAVTLDLVADHEVEQARRGPRPDAIQQQLGQRRPDARNLEAHFRLGLALVNEGRWREAAEVFDRVERVHPGFRNAGARAEEIQHWEKAVDHTMARQGDADEEEVVGRYRILGELGRGGMAVVYRAQDESLQREVALKFISEAGSGRDEVRDLFTREARSAAGLNHPNIVTIYDFGTLNDRPFICMELVAGHTVQEVLEEEERMKVLDALRVAEHILKALEYAHEKGIVHRDIKPSNMMGNEHGVWKLMDFGLAKSISGGANTTRIAGTPLYMAPEQFTGKKLDASTDIFALGASLYEMLAGTPPFCDGGRDQPPPPLREVVPRGIPAMLDKLVLQSLEFSQDRRIHSAREMREPINYILKSVKTYVGRLSQSD